VSLPKNQIKFIVVITNLETRMATTQFLSTKSWADVQNVLGFELLKNVFHEEKFDAIFTDGDVSVGGMTKFLALVRASKKNFSTTVVCIHQPEGFIRPKAGTADKNCYYWPLPLKEADLTSLKAEIDKARSGGDHAKSFDARLLNAVLAAVRDVIATYFTSENVEFMKPNLRKAPLLERSGISGLIPIEGEKFKGAMVMAASLDFLQNLANKVFPEQQVKLTKEVSIDVLSELVNLCSKQMKLQFGNLGLTSDMGQPEVFMGKQHTLPHKVIDSAIFLGMKVFNSLCEIELTISQASDFAIDETRVLVPKKDLVMFE